MTMFRRALTASAVAIILASVPSHLAAQERESQGSQTSVVEWVSAIWGDLATWLADAVTSPPPTEPGGGSTTQGSCAIDPNGGCPEHG